MVAEWNQSGKAHCKGDSMSRTLTRLGIHRAQNIKTDSTHHRANKLARTVKCLPETSVRKDVKKQQVITFITKLPAVLTEKGKNVGDALSNIKTCNDNEVTFSRHV